MSKAMGLLLILPALALAVAVRLEPGENFKSGAFEPPRVAPDFELQGSTGSVIELSAYRGKVVALAFGFSHCPRVCPVTLAKLAEVSKRLEASSRAFQTIFVTVDPERDNPGRLKEFLDFFDPDFVGATGDEVELKALHTAYGVTASRVVSTDQRLKYEVHHSSSIYLIDREGKLRVLVPFGKSADDILHDVELLLEE